MRSRSVGVLGALTLLFALSGIEGALLSCGSNTPPSGDGGDAGEGGDAGQDGGCQPFSDAAEWDVPSTPNWEAGVPFPQLRFAMAVAQCGYSVKCTPLAAYEVSECIAALTSANAWEYIECSSSGPFECYGRGFPATPAPFELAAVDAGAMTYDPVRAAACLAALEAQPCHGVSLSFQIPACVDVFSCVDGGTGDGGSCNLPFGSTALTPCTTNNDCADSGAYQYCVAGYCDTEPCDGFPSPTSQCLVFVGKGQPCDSDPPLLGGTVYPAPWGVWPTKSCSPGFTCRGVSADGGLGVCDDAREIGAACDQAAAISGCAVGLVCQCGACAMPPSRGPCVGYTCQVGVAYCDLDGGTCQPVVQQGGDCSAGFEVCAPDLVCDSTSHTCQPSTL